MNINWKETFYVIPIAVGGKSDPVPVRILDSNVEYYLLADRARARAIATLLFTTHLRFTGRGRWRRLENSVWDLASPSKDSRVRAVAIELRENVIAGIDMSTQASRPGQIEQIDEDLKRVLDERVEAAKVDPERVSREDLLRNGLQKLKTHVPR